VSYVHQFDHMHASMLDMNARLSWNNSAMIRTAITEGRNPLLNNYRAMLCISVIFAVAWCPSVRPSVTLVDCIQTSKVIVKLLSWASSAIILVFWPSADTQFQGESLQWGCKIQGGWKFLRFSTEIAVYLGNGMR